MGAAAIERAMRRLAQTSEARYDPAARDVAFERAQAQLESLAEATAALEATLPGRVGEAVREGLRAESLPVARQLAETRGLAGQTLRRLERLEGSILTERHARVDDLALLVDLITSGWRSVDQRLARIEAALARPAEAVVYSMDERRVESSGGLEGRS